jgi:hypothetical protein
VRLAVVEHGSPILDQIEYVLSAGDGLCSVAEQCEGALCAGVADASGEDGDVVSQVSSDLCGEERA